MTNTTVFVEIKNTIITGEKALFLWRNSFFFNPSEIQRKKYQQSFLFLINYIDSRNYFTLFNL